MSTLYDISNEYVEILANCQSQEELSDDLTLKLETINQKYGENSVVTAGEIAPEFKKSSEAAGTPKENKLKLITDISISRNNGVCQVRNLKKKKSNVKLRQSRQIKGFRSCFIRRYEPTS